MYSLTENCVSCHINLLDRAPVKIIRHQITELPEIKPVVIETQQYEVVCPCCGEVHRGQLPERLEAERYLGPRLEANVIMIDHEHHNGVERLVKVCREIFNLSLSEGGAVPILKSDRQRSWRKQSRLTRKIVRAR